MIAQTDRVSEMQAALDDISAHACSMNISPNAVRRYYEMGFLAAAVARRLTDADHGDNTLTDEKGEPITMTKR